MAKPTVIFKQEQHRNLLVLSMYTPNAEPFNGIVRKLKATYSVTKKAWWLPYSKESVNRAFDAFKEVAWVDYSAIDTKRHSDRPQGVEESKTGQTGVSHSTRSVQATSAKTTKTNWTQAQKEAMWAYAEKLTIRRYSKSTFKTYGTYFKQFLAAHPEQEPKNISEEQIKKHIVATVKKHNYANKTQNQIVNAIKFYYEQVLGLPKAKYWIPRPRKEFKLPVVASEEEIIRTIVAADNLKHQCIIALLYSTGLRRSELINLRKADIDIERKQVFVRAGKGKKDRTTLLSEKMINALVKYYDAYKPETWVFEGVNGGQYAGTSVGKLLKRAANKAGVEKNITPHVLRHSFATHLMDKGTDTRYIQELLGHKNLNTTAIYAHVSKKDLMAIVSPLDRIFEDNKLKNKHLHQNR